MLSNLEIRLDFASVYVQFYLLSKFFQTENTTIFIKNIQFIKTTSVKNNDMT